MSLYRALFRHTVETKFGTFEKDLRGNFRYAVVHKGCAGGELERDGAASAAGCYGFARDIEKADHLAQLANRKGCLGVEVVKVTNVRKVAEDSKPRRLPDGSIREP